MDNAIRWTVYAVGAFVSAVIAETIVSLRHSSSVDGVVAAPDDAVSDYETLSPVE